MHFVPLRFTACTPAASFTKNRLRRVQGGNRFHFIRLPTPLDQQTVMRMNLDTLYAGAVIDTAKGAAITMPPMPDGRYASVLLIDNDHYAVDVLYEPAAHCVQESLPAEL